MKIDPDKNPEYQTLVDTLFALNCASSIRYEIEVVSEAKIHLISDDRVLLTASLTRILEEVVLRHRLAS